MDKKKKYFILIFLVAVLVFLMMNIFGLSLPSFSKTVYVCSDGSSVSFASSCPKEQTKEKIWTCEDGTKVEDYSECCKTRKRQPVGTGFICIDITGTYADTGYCDANTQVIESYKCQYNRCMKIDISPSDCPEWAVCRSDGKTVWCEAK